MGIDIVSFSPSGKRLIGIDNTVDHNLVIYDLTDKYSEGGCKMVEDKAGREPTVEVRWVNEDLFVTIGPKIFKIWNIEKKGEN